MKAYPPEATPPSNWAMPKKEPPPRILRWLLTGYIWMVMSIMAIVALLIIGISIFEWSVPILYDWTH